MILFTAICGSGTVRLNTERVGDFVASGEAVEFEITSQLQPFNELVVDLSFDPQQSRHDSGGICGVVALEIRSE